MFIIIWMQQQDGISYSRRGRVEMNTTAATTTSSSTSTKVPTRSEAPHQFTSHLGIILPTNSIPQLFLANVAQVHFSEFLELCFKRSHVIFHYKDMTSRGKKRQGLERIGWLHSK